MSRRPRLLGGALAFALAASLIFPAIATAGTPTQDPALGATPPSSTGASATLAPATPGAGVISQDQAVAAAKAAFPVPDTLTEFHANYYENSGPTPRKSWSLTWSEPNRPGAFRGQESISFEVDAVTGGVRSMNRYRVLPDGSSAPSILLTREEAQVRAQDVINRLQSSRLSQLKLAPASLDQYLYPGSLTGPVIYNYTWQRVMNGVPVANEGLMQGAWVNVDASDGTVVGYGSDWNDQLTYPDPKGAIPLDQAAKAWLDKLGLELQYQTVNDILGSGSKPKVALVYAWRLPYANFAVDALTGKVVDQRGQEVQADMLPQTIQWPQVTPDPAVTGPLSREQALALAQRILGLGSDWQLTSAGYNDAGYLPEASWNFNWNRTTGSGKDQQVENASVTLGAKSGRIFNFYHGLPWKPGDENLTPTLSQDQALTKALTFIAAHLPGEVGNLRLVPSNQVGPVIKQGRGYNFGFERLINGIPFPASSLQVGVDGMTGDITSFYSNQPDVEGAFPDKDKAIDLTTASQDFLNEVGLELTYRPQYKADDSASTGKVGVYVDSLQSQAQLVYEIPAFYRGLRLDATTGRVTDSYGRDVQMLVQPPKDVAGNWAERDILIVAARGLLTVNNQGLFEPGRALSRAEAARLLVLAFGRGEVFAKSARYADVAAASPYSGYIESAAEAGWLDVTDGTFRPDDPVTREEFAGMLVRALGYSKVAKMSVQIPMSYADVAAIDPALRNSVALGAGLGIFSPTGSFRPKDPLTRAEAAVTILRVARVR